MWHALKGPSGSSTGVSGASAVFIVLSLYWHDTHEAVLEPGMLCALGHEQGGKCLVSYAQHKMMSSLVVIISLMCDACS